MCFNQCNNFYFFKYSRYLLPTNTGKKCFRSIFSQNFTCIKRSRVHTEVSLSIKFNYAFHETYKINSILIQLFFKICNGHKFNFFYLYNNCTLRSLYKWGLRSSSITHFIKEIAFIFNIDHNFIFKEYVTEHFKKSHYIINLKVYYTNKQTRTSLCPWQILRKGMEKSLLYDLISAFYKTHNWTWSRSSIQYKFRIHYWTKRWVEIDSPLKPETHWDDL